MDRSQARSSGQHGRFVLDVLATLVEAGRLGTRPDATVKADPAVEEAADQTGAVGG